MARIKKTHDVQHRLTIEADRKDGDFVLVRGKKRAYLWAGKPNMGCVTLSGETTLRRLAKEILAELED